MGGVEISALLEAIARMARSETRREAAREVAMMVGATDLIVFIEDKEVARLLPAPGFPQTLPDGRAWRSLLDATLVTGSAEGSMKFPSVELPPPPGREEKSVNVRTRLAADGSVVAFLEPSLETHSEVLLTLLPLITVACRGEAAHQAARAEVALAREAAAQATALAAKLDTTRRELRLAVEVAEAATLARDQFLATVSHELRTPLTSILGWLQFMKAGEPTSDELREAFDTIERSAKAQNRLVEDILDYSRATLGKLALHVEPVNLVTVVREAFDIGKPGAAAKGVIVTLDPGPDRVVVSGDSDRLRQVIWNLLSNAVKFTPTGGRVNVSVTTEKGDAVVCVSDSGEGMEPAFLHRAFERFSQSDASSTRPHAGLGLGLSIVRHLVELHGGTVSARSEGPGRGAELVVRLPLSTVSRIATIIPQERSASSRP